MQCCPDCFTDPSIKQIVESKSTGKGRCSICEARDVAVVKCDALIDYFDPLFQLYSNHPSAERSLKITTPVFLFKHLHLYWPTLFDGKLTEAQVHKLVKAISVSSEADPRLFAESVELKRYVDEDPLNPADGLEQNWDYFSSEIKTRNRYFFNEMIETDDLSSIFERLATTYPAGTEFHRARLSDNLLGPGDLLKPPAYLTKGGRANPVGIPYLYLSNDLKTTLFETRISLHETVTVGRFVALEPINLVSLRNVKEWGPFEVQEKGFDLEYFISYRPYLQKLETELSKPVRKQDVDLDYLPTQFLCELIKSLGFDAVEYKSAMNPNGFNLAVFNDSKLECVNTKFYSVNHLEYDWEEL